MSEFLNSTLALHIVIGVVIFFVVCMATCILAFIFDTEHNESYYDEEEEWHWYCVNVRNKRVPVPVVDRVAWEKEGF